MMDNAYDHMLNQQMMAVSIFSFLDNLLDHVRQAEQEAENEMETVSESVDPVAQARKDAGGYPEESFVHLSEVEKDEISCTICYCILRDAYQCKNQHRFCYTCIFAWSSTTGASSDFCPVCRCDALYGRNDALNERIQQLRCICKESGCNWRGSLRDLESHQHRQYTDQELGIAAVLPVIKNKSHGTSASTTTPNKLNISTGNTGLTTLLPTRQSTTDLVRASRIQSSHDNSLIENNIAAATTGTNTNVATSSPLSTGGNLLSRRDSQTPRRISVAGAAESPRNAPRSESDNTLYQANSPARRTSLSSRNGSATTNNINQQSTPSTSTTVHAPRPPNVPRNPGGMFRNRMSSASRNPSESPAETSSVSTATITSEDTQTTSTILSVQNSIGPPSLVEGSLIPTAGTSETLTQTTASVVNSQPSTSTESSTTIEGPDSVVYERLIPIERRSRVTARLRESREQLAMMLTLMTLELEDRRRTVEMQMSLNTHRQRMRARQMAEMSALNQRLDELSTTEGSDVASSSTSLSSHGTTSLPPILITNRNRNDMGINMNPSRLSFRQGDNFVIFRNTRNAQNSDSSSTSSGDD